MAWQLIYTSAPRLLEAGRSGFGTVARHRSIHPLLVTVIERDSQFDRGTGGAVFAHRILTAAGSRFHVLTCIRDAGADYTGRTNHIAHHLVIEPREIAALGSTALTPADALAQMNWLPSWSESPRWLDGADEIPLARFRHQPGAASAWQTSTGEARRAALLQPVRDACIILPPGADALALFAESLRRAPAQSWQATFTTSLQAGDEPGDFRWLGLAASSPLRATGENGRAVLDLTVPYTLPIPSEPVPVPANAQSAMRSGGNLFLPVQTSRAATGPARMGSLFDDKLAAAAPHRARRSRATVWLGFTALAAALAAGVIFFVLPMLGESSEITQQREAIRAAVNTVFSGEDTDAAALGDVPAEKLNAARSLADAVRQTADELSRGALTPACRQANAGARTDARLAALNLPPAINQLFDFHAAFTAHEAALRDAATPGDFDELTAFAEDKSVASSLKLAVNYRERFKVRIAKARDERAPRQHAASEPGRKTKPIEPRQPEKPKPFTPPMAVPVGKRFEGELMVLPPTDKTAWREFASKLRTSGGELRWHKDGSAQGEKLLKGGKGYRVGVGDAVFLLGEKPDELTPGAAAIPPYELVILKGKSRFVTAWVPKDEIPFRVIEGGIKRDGSNFQVTDAEMMDLLRVAQDNRWKTELALPRECSPFTPAEIHRLQIGTNGSADADKLMVAAKQRIVTEERTEREARAVADGKTDSPAVSDAVAAINRIVAALARRPNKKDGREMGKPNPAAFTSLDHRDTKSLGKCLIFFSHLESSDALYEAGRRFLAPEERELKGAGLIAAMMPDTIKAIDDAITRASKLGDWKNEKEKTAAEADRELSLSRLEPLKTMFAALRDESGIRSKAATKADDAAKLLKQLRSCPLLKPDKLPNGEYRLIVQTSNNASPLSLVLFKIQ